MKKLIICLALATVAVSCKKIQAGGNKNTLKLEEGVERYSDDAQGGEAHGHEAAAGHKEEAAAKPEAETPKTDSTAAAAAKPAESEKAPKAEH
ncbi:hypothetical protein [Chryseobacterium pennipullorum]|uniref:Lipoprotein n=1 Tax=Chryseobacterium pennipullorum TaxID=2258963 RepID=A0A3D9B8Q8_9FLAO|nr:hypothetical protein [Chryseobacterium pennipullorum]REC50044.1 hypothetical protein DRF67_00415 [Chryseobacterium pennipullorum]